MSKVKIDKNDSNRVLLTDLLPYEVPMLFSNDGFYSIISNDRSNYYFNKLKNARKRFAGSNFSIPFTYEIAKTGDSDSRKLSLMHPVNQVDFVDFYKKYESVILHLCSKSPFSLRKVSNVAKYCYSPDLVFDEDEHKNEEVEVEPEVLDAQTRLFKSYFTYAPIDLIYKFYERREYQRLEQKFDFSLEFDISKCFYNIYTHSISWAVKGKEAAKANKDNSSFENQFDKIMQHANYGETNGILVGPEVSRIFAEIILQQIDINVLKSLERRGWQLGVDYEIKRYVDDYFVFSNNEAYLDEILKVYKKELEEYKLYVNAAKTEKRRAPFISDIAVGKREVKKVISELFEAIVKHVEKDGKMEVSFEVSTPSNISQNFIKDFQCIVKRNRLTYDVLNKEVVRVFKKKLTKLFRGNIVSSDDSCGKFFQVYLDILFYTYSLHLNSSATYKMSQIIVLIAKFLNFRTEELKHSVFSRIFKETDFVMTNYQRKSKLNETNVETLNLLIALKKLGSEYLLSPRKIYSLFNLDKTDVGEKREALLRLNYFHIITLLYYFADIGVYKAIREEIENTVVRKFELEDHPFIKAEYTCLFFDFICCPYVDNKAKKKVMAASKYSVKDLTVEIDKIEGERSWFMNWDEEIDLEAVLKKKEWGSSY